MPIDVAYITPWVFIVAVTSPGVLVLVLVYALSRAAWASERSMHQVFKIHERLSRVETETEVLFRMIERGITSRLCAPSNVTMTTLFQKLADGTISADEARTLHQMILERGDQIVMEDTIRPELAVKTLAILALEVRIYHAKNSKGHKVV